MRERLLLAAAFERADGFDSVVACRDAHMTLWGLEVEIDELSGTHERLLQSGQLTRTGTGFKLADSARAEISQVVEDSRAVEHKAFEDWRLEVLRDRPHLEEEAIRSVQPDLEQWLHHFITSLGMQAAVVLYPEDPRFKSTLDDVRDLGFDLLPEREEELAALRRVALPLFIHSPTDAQRRHLSNLLATAYMFAVFTIDPQAERALSTLTNGQRVYLDTNVLYAVFGLNGPENLESSLRTLELTKKLGFELAVTPWTVAEMHRSIAHAREVVRGLNLPPRHLAGLGSDIAKTNALVTAYLHAYQRHGVSPADFYAVQDQFEANLEHHGIQILDAGCRSVEDREHDVAEQLALLAQVPGGEGKPPRVARHDVLHRLLIEQLRGEGHRPFRNAATGS